VVPEVSLPVAVGSVFSERCLLFSERDGDALTQIETDAITAIIGSEGGWSDEELEQARAAGVRIVTLGGRILRAETAAITVAALLQHRFGDLK
jgi:16S rRNA (uracil1498-N3)-methyltransferase